MGKRTAIWMGVLLVLFLLPATHASVVGLGMSPTKWVVNAAVGQETRLEGVVFNSGGEELGVSLNAEGDIAPFVSFPIGLFTVIPEPDQELPIENGQTFTVIIKPTKEGTFTGTVAAVGGPAQNSQFGGMVSVAAALLVTVGPPASPLDAITMQQMLIAGSAIAFLLLFVILKKVGLKLTFERKGKGRDLEDV